MNSNPIITNPLFGSGIYQFSLAKFPEISFFCTDANVPGVSIGRTMVSTRIHDIPLPSETMEFEDLQVSFTIDEKLKNYLSIHDWIIGMGFPEDTQQYVDVLNRQNNVTSVSELFKGFTDGSLIILDNNNRPSISVEFKDCFPTNLSSIQFNSTNTDSQPMTAQATFAYSSHSIKVL